MTDIANQEAGCGPPVPVQAVVRPTRVCITDKEEADILLALRALVRLGITKDCVFDEPNPSRQPRRECGVELHGVVLPPDSENQSERK